MTTSFKKYSIVLLLISLPLVGYGTHLQAISPTYAVYQQHQIDTIEAANPDKDLAPGVGLGLVMASAWPFTVLIQGILILMFIVSTLIVRSITKRIKTKPIIWAVFTGFIGFWASAIIVVLRSAIENMRWSFTLLSMAEIITAFGLIIGSIGLIKELRAK